MEVREKECLLRRLFLQLVKRMWKMQVSLSQVALLRALKHKCPKL